MTEGDDPKGPRTGPIVNLRAKSPAQVGNVFGFDSNPCSPLRAKTCFANVSSHFFVGKTRSRKERFKKEIFSKITEPND
jgi:hypothetical protein